MASLGVGLALFAAMPSDSSSSSGRPRLTVVARPLVQPAAAIEGSIRIEARFRSPTRGTFEIRGAVSDAGPFTVTRVVGGGRLRLTETLAGRSGTIRIRASRPCAGGAGAWHVLSGTGAHARLSGGGAASGGPRCGATSYPVRATYTGTVRTPAPPPRPPAAQAGRFGGGTSLREEVVFDVAEGGRTLSGLRLVVTAPCTGPTVPARVQMSFPAAIEIGSDKSFSVPSNASWWNGAVTGRFTSPTTAAGTASVSTEVTVTSTNTRYPCSANVTWTASLPPPAATPGRYCGFTLQGPGVCFDVAASGRTVSRFEVGVVIRCQPLSEWEVDLVFVDAPVAGNLGFSQRVTSFEGLLAGTGQVSGLIDLDGVGASGQASLRQVSFDHEGTRYACVVGGAARWTAKRQS